MKKIILTIIFFILVFNFIFAQSACPNKTTTGNNYIIFAGKVDGLGGDENVKVWFEYGETKNNLNKKTKELILTKPGIFCIKVDKLASCKNYYYRAVAKNKAGVNYGEIKSIKTLCSFSKISKNKKLKSRIKQKNYLSNLLIF